MGRIVKGNKGKLSREHAAHRKPESPSQLKIELGKQRDILRRLNRLNKLDTEEAYLAVAFPGWAKDPVSSTEKVPAVCRCLHASQAEHLAHLIEEGGTPAVLVWTVEGSPPEIRTEVLPWARDKEGYVASIVEAFSGALPRLSSAAIQ
jgi:hypothetical protein